MQILGADLPSVSDAHPRDRSSSLSCWDIQFLLNTLNKLGIYY